MAGAVDRTAWLVLPQPAAAKAITTAARAGRRVLIGRVNALHRSYSPSALATFAARGFALVAGARLYFAMNASVSSRASASGRWCIGDFIR